MKIICVGRNYVDHAVELNNPVPQEPLLFMKPSTALLINNKPFYYPDFSKDIQYEVEVVLKIGKNGKHIQSAFVPDYIDAIGLGIDFTARDIQSRCKEQGHPWEVAKAFDHSAVVGKFFEINRFEDLKSIKFSLNKNGSPVQSGDTKDMIFDFHYLIQYISQRFTLHIGDYIFTGTPAGVGPITVGDQFEGFLQNELVFSCAIK